MKSIEVIALTLILTIGAIVAVATSWGLWGKAVSSIDPMHGWLRVEVYDVTCTQTSCSVRVAVKAYANIMLISIGGEKLDIIIKHGEEKVFSVSTPFPPPDTLTITYMANGVTYYYYVPLR